MFVRHSVGAPFDSRSGSEDPYYRNQRQFPVAAETQRRVMRLRISPTTGLSSGLMWPTPAAQSVGRNIRRIEALVNEMAIQFCCCDTPVVLSGIAKTNGTVWVTRKTLSCRIERQFARRCASVSMEVPSDAGKISRRQPFRRGRARRVELSVWPARVGHRSDELRSGFRPN